VRNSAAQPICSNPCFSLHRRSQIEVLYLGTLLRLLNEQIPFESVSAQKLQERAFHFILEIDRFVSPPELNRQRKHLVALCQSILASLSRCGFLAISKTRLETFGIVQAIFQGQKAKTYCVSPRPWMWQQQRSENRDVGVMPVATLALPPVCNLAITALE
jgi:hypothetical protein